MTTLHADRLWQPIETASKDGTVVDLWIVPTLGYPSQLPQRKTDCAWVDNAWRHRRDGRVEYLGIWRATHWMPLPAPPAGGSQ